jgi:hypothetical protein
MKTYNRWFILKPNGTPLLRSAATNERDAWQLALKDACYWEAKTRQMMPNTKARAISKGCRSAKCTIQIPSENAEQWRDADDGLPK